MRAEGKARVAARLSCAAAALLACAPSAALAQQAPPPQPQPPGSAELDPTAPLDPMPDLGVEWPDMQAEPAATVDNAAPQPITDAAAERRYSLAIQGLENVDGGAQLVEAFDEQSALRAGRDKEANAAQIDRRSKADAELLAELLRSRGYYDAVVQPRIEPRGETLAVLLDAEPGQQYRFASVELPGVPPELRPVFAVKDGDPIIAEDVIKAGADLKVALGEQGFALAEIGEQRIDLDHSTGTAALVLPVSPGPVARFGAIRVDGRPPFSAKHVATIARFKAGDAFAQSKVNDLRRALIATGLVASTEVRLVPSADRRTVDVAVHLEPAPTRTIAGEVGYGTGEGIRAEASWQHRNFLNPEGALTLRGVAGTKEQLAAVEFRRNNFGRRDRVLDLQALASKVDRDAYRARTVLLGAQLERQSNIIWRKTWTWSVGADVILTDERGVFDDPQTKQTRTFLLLTLPASLRYDRSNDLLDPTDGFRIGGSISPEISAHGGSFGYARTQLDASAYHPVSTRTVLAGRVRLATILGAQAADIAPSRRLYAGGGGSVRGYGYQQLGPRDAFGDPIGGRGLAEFSLEARHKLDLFGGNFGIVPFLDGGTLTSDIAPGTNGWQFGAGIGVRYYSSFGPIRVDVGTPLNPREGDAPVAVVVSLGQAF